MRLLCSLVLCGLILSMAARAGEDIDVLTLKEGAVSPPASIEALDWLDGHWQGEGLGGAAREIIAPAAGGQKMGMFHHLKPDGGLNFYEFYVFAESGDTLVLRIKHFTPELVGWETKDDYVEFALVAVAHNAVYFDGLTFARTAPGTLQSAVNIEGKGVVQFTFGRLAHQ